MARRRQTNSAAYQTNNVENPPVSILSDLGTSQQHKQQKIDESMTTLFFIIALFSRFCFSP